MIHEANEKKLLTGSDCFRFFMNNNWGIMPYLHSIPFSSYNNNNRNNYNKNPILKRSEERRVGKEC